MASKEETGELFRWKALNLFTVVINGEFGLAISEVTFERSHFGWKLPPSFLTLMIHHILLTSAILWLLYEDFYTNHLRWPELANCVTVPRTKKPAMPKTPPKPKKSQEQKKPTTATKSTESPTPKPKRKRQETKKATKEPDRKILVAVDL